MAPYFETAVGYLMSPEAKENCGLCPVASMNDVMETMGLDIRISSAWKDVGYLTVYEVFNVLAIFGVYWLVRDHSMHMGSLPKQKKNRYSTVVEHD